MSPVRCLVSEVKHTACGGDFTVWLSSIEGASILYGLWICLDSVFFILLVCRYHSYSAFRFLSTAGLPQYGQLGHGTDNEVLCSGFTTFYSMLFSLN